jgi:hypothetical protein
MDILQAGEPKHMPSVHRDKRWRREYMKDYRQGLLRGDGTEPSTRSTKREELKAAQRVYSFKWRLSKLLSHQYDILLFLQYEPEHGIFQTNDGMILGYDDEFCNDVNEVILCFRILDLEFEYPCNTGGNELFKVFLFRTYSKKWDQATDCVVGVLDKAVLLEQLQQLPNQGGQRWEKILSKVKTEARKGRWHKLDFSDGSAQWIRLHTECYLLKWTKRKRPQWSSSKLYKLLCRWEKGNYKIGIGKRDNPNDTMKVIVSPILWGD